MPLTKETFRVGMNEGIVVKRESLDHIDLYTDGLTGCVALVAENRQFVFMAHVFAEIENKESKERSSDPNLIKSIAKKYLQQVLEHIGIDGSLKIHLVANGLYAPMITAFDRACSELGLSYEKTPAGVCRVKLDREKSIVIRDAPPAGLQDKNTVGTFSSDGTDLIVDRIDADGISVGNYGLGGETNYPGDGLEALDPTGDERVSNWIRPGALYRASKELLRTIAEHGQPSTYIHDLFGQVQEAIEDMGLTTTITADDRVKICQWLTNEMQAEKPAITPEEMRESINRIVAASLSPGIPSSPLTATHTHWIYRDEEVDEEPVVIVTEKQDRGLTFPKQLMGSGGVGVSAEPPVPPSSSAPLHGHDPVASRHWRRPVSPLTVVTEERKHSREVTPDEGARRPRMDG